MIIDAISLSADEKSGSLVFEFKGVVITVHPDSNHELIYRDYNRAWRGYIDKNVGPTPTPTLTDKEKESDAQIEEVRNRLRWERVCEHEAEAD